MIRFGKIVFFLTFFAMMVQALIFFVGNPNELMMVPLVLILGGAGVFFLRRVSDEDADFQVNIFLWAFSIRLWMGMILYGWGLGELFGDEDASGYKLGWQFANNWYQNGLDGLITDLASVFFTKQNVGQAVIWAIPSFLAGGQSRMIVSVVNSFAGALLVIVIFRMTRRVFSSATGRTAAILVTFWASNILLSATTAKEMLVIFFEWTILYLLIRDEKGITAKSGLLAVPVFLAVFSMRFYALYILAAATLFKFFVSSRENLVRNVVFGFVLVSSLMIFLGAGGAINRDFDRIDRLNDRVESWRANVVKSTGSGVEIYSEYDNPTVAIPVATVYFLLAPFPWEMFSGTVRNAFGAVENIFIFAILLLGFPAIKIFFVDKFAQMAPVFVFCVLYAGMQIWGLSNVGLAWRHKQTIMPLFFMLVAVAISQRKAGWQLLSGQFNRDRRLNIIRAN